MKENVVQLRKDDLTELAIETKDMVLSGEITGLMIAGQLKDGTIVTAWADADGVVRQNMLSHLQLSHFATLVEGMFVEDAD